MGLVQLRFKKGRVKPKLLLGNSTACPGALHKAVLTLKRRSWSKVCQVNKGDFVGMLKVEQAHSTSYNDNNLK